MQEASSGTGAAAPGGVGEPVHRVQARNTATASENKIHDDAEARRFGFRGGLVPGVDVYAYLTHPAVARLGLDWLQRGAMRARFDRPVYDGDEVVVTAAPAGDAIELAVSCGGEVRATGRAAARPAAAAAPDLEEFPAAPLPVQRPPASPGALRPGTLLGSVEAAFHAERALEYLDSVGETLSVYRERRIAHPGYLLRSANHVLARNVVLGPWIHAGSEAQHLGLVGDGDVVSTRARVIATYERRGHGFVELDVLLVANAARPVMRVRHVAIYAPRKRRAA